MVTMQPVYGQRSVFAPIAVGPCRTILLERWTYDIYSLVICSTCMCHSDGDHHMWPARHHKKVAQGSVTVLYIILHLDVTCITIIIAAVLSNYEIEYEVA